MGRSIGGDYSWNAGLCAIVPMLCGWLLIVSNGVAASELVTETLDALVASGVTAYQQGDYVQAHDSLEKLYIHYGNADTHADSMWEMLMPVYGELKYRTGKYQEAVEVLRQYLSQYPNGEARQTAMMMLGEVWAQLGEWQQADQVWESYEREFVLGSELGKIRIRRAEMAFLSGDNKLGFQRLQEICEGSGSRIPLLFRNRARLLALLQCIGLDAMEEAADLLLGRVWREEEIDEWIPWVGAVLQVADHFLEQERYPNATALYRLVPAKSQVMAMQQRRLEEVETQAKRSSVLRAHYQELTERLKGQLTDWQDVEDYTAPCWLRRAYALGQCGRPREAWILLEDLTEAANTADEWRKKAHYQWLLIVCQMQRWEKARELALRYMNQYPNCEQVPQVSYMVVQSWQEQGEYTQAIEFLDELIRQFPKYENIAHWYYYRGYLKIILEQYEDALKDLATVEKKLVAQTHDKDNLRYQATLWIGLSRFFEKRYDEALRILEGGLKALPENHALSAEYEYRIAATYYAMRDYPRALSAIDDYLEKYAFHFRAAESRILKGDILMGEGRLQDALECYGVIDEDENMYAYARFQMGKIYRVREEYVQMHDHFMAYVDNETGLPRIRLAEALYWVGWALEQQGREREAGEVYLQALSRTGNDLREGEVIRVLQGLREWHGKIRAQSDEESNIQASTDSAALSEQVDFLDWVIGEMQTAIDNERMTWYSRLAVTAAGLLEERGEWSRADELWEQLSQDVQISLMDPEAIGKIGLRLLQSDITLFPEYFEYLQDHYGQTKHRVTAWYGLGRICFLKGEYLRSVEYLQRLLSEPPENPLVIRGVILLGETWLRLGKGEQAVDCFEEVLRWRQARGRTHAQALIGMGKAYNLLGKSEQAVACLQRVYTMYRSWPDLVVEAYERSARLFEQLGDQKAAHQSWLILAQSSELGDYVDRGRAMQEIGRLQQLMVKEQ